MSGILTSLLDANIYGNDLALFRPGNWLNDSCINYCFRRLEQEIQQKSILFMDPSVVSFLLIQCTTAEEYCELSLGVQIMERTGKSFHFDSCGMSNNRAAQFTAVKFFALIDRKDYPHIVQVADCPQQSNGYDCGVYVLLNAEYLAHQLTLQTSIEKQVNPDDLLKNFNDTSFSITALVADSFRLKIYSEIVLFHEADRQRMEQY